MSKKIISKTGKKHSYDTLDKIFSTLEGEEKASIIESLGLGNIVGDNGELIPVYSADIVSDTPNFLPVETDTTITLSAKVYNYFKDVTEKASEFTWSRDSGVPEEDANWTRAGQNILLTMADLTSRFTGRRIVFKVTATVDKSFVSDTIFFSSLSSYMQVSIKGSHSMMIDDEPSEVIFSPVVSGITPKTYAWYVNDSFETTDKELVLKSKNIESGTNTQIRLEVRDTANEDFVATLMFPKIQDGKTGAPGVPGLNAYTHIKYADSEDGTVDFSDYPIKADGSPREYLGISANNHSPVESQDPKDYMWSKFIGDQGIPGVSGYMWIKYSLYPLGRDSKGAVSMIDSPYDTQTGSYMMYLGIAYNKVDPAESMVPEDYMWSKVHGNDGQQGPPGVPGSVGPIPMQKEWVTGLEYVNNTERKDFIYYRPSGPSRGWYTVKGLKATAGNAPDLNLFEKVVTTEQQLFETIVAENANLAGFIFKNQKLYSQQGLDPSADPQYANLLLDGFKGVIKFLERLTIDKEGITFFDTNKRPRLLISLQEEVPKIQFKDTAGVVTWEAGKDGYIVIKEGTTIMSWSDATGFRRIVELGTDKNIDVNSPDSKSKLVNATRYLINAGGIDGQLLTPFDDAYFSKSAMPDSYGYDPARNSGGGYLLDKGDMLANKNKHEAYYISKGLSVNKDELPTDKVVADGWYIINGQSGVNGSLLLGRLLPPDYKNIEYFIKAYHVKDGVIDYDIAVEASVHTKTMHNT